MAYDEDLADRVRLVLNRRRGITEKKMFGGIAFLVNGNMACGIVKDELMLRLGEEGVDGALVQDHTRPMDFTGKVLKTMVYVGPEGIRTAASLKAWVEKGVGFARSLPAKS